MTRQNLPRVLCVDDHRMVREGLVEILEKQADIEVVASGETGADAVRLYGQHRPDVTPGPGMPDGPGKVSVRGDPAGWDAPRCGVDFFR